MAEIVKNLGMFEFAANFKVKAAEALDPRMVAASKADLINKANWPSDGDTVYVYKGLIVDCGEDGVYRLTNPDLVLDPSYAGWERIDAGAIERLPNIFTYKGSVESFDGLPNNANVGDVYNVEAEFVITSELGGDKTYPAGTNVAWTGSEWDALAGSIDLSNYATKGETSELRSGVGANTSAIEQLGIDLGLANVEIAKKVDAVEGSSLISSDKLELIDTNAAEIAKLQTADTTFDARLQAVEGMIGDGGEVDLSSLTTLVTSQGTKITSLETDNETNKTNISNLQTQANGLSERLTAVETVNTEQATQLNTLTERVTTVEAYGTAISNLTSTVNGHTTEISNIKTSIEGLAVKNVKEGDKFLAANGGLLSTSIDINYNSETQEIELLGINGEVVNSISAAPFIKDGMIDSVNYDSTNKTITIAWNTMSGKTESTTLNLSDLIDVYTAGSGLQLVGNQFSTKLSSSENNKLTISADGLLVDISADIAAINASVDNKISNALSWEDVN